MLVFTSVLHFCTKQANFVASGIFIQNLMLWKWIYVFNQKFEAFKSRLLWIFHKYSILACNIRTVFDTIGSSVVVKTFLASLCTTWDFLPQKGKVMQERTRTNPVCKSIWKLMSPFEASIINQTTTTYYYKWKFLTFSNSKLSWKNVIQLELKSTMLRNTDRLLIVIDHGLKIFFSRIIYWFYEPVFAWDISPVFIL